MAPRASDYNALRHKFMKFIELNSSQHNARCMAQPQPRNQALGVPQSGRHNSKPEGGRLATNAITGLKPRRARYDVTDPGSAGVQLRVMPSGAKRWYFRFYWRNKRQRLGLGQWPAV